MAQQGQEWEKIQFISQQVFLLMVLLLKISYLLVKTREMNRKKAI